MNNIRHSRFMRALRSGNITVSLAFCALGVVLIAIPGFSLKALCVTGGLILCASGTLRLIRYLDGTPDPLFSFRMPGAILLLLMGMFLLFRSDSAIGLTSTILGIAVLLFGLGKIRSANILRNSGFPFFDSGMPSAILILLSGVLLLFRPIGSAHMITSAVGVVTLLLGVTNTAAAVRSVKFNRPEAPHIFEGHFHDI